jgi:hypothetical protein
MKKSSAGGGSRTHPHREVNRILSPAKFLIHFFEFIFAHEKSQTLDSRQPTGENSYFLTRFFFLCHLHTVEVTGSILVSPTIILSTT